MIPTIGRMIHSLTIPIIYIRRKSRGRPLSSTHSTMLTFHVLFSPTFPWLPVILHPFPLPDLVSDYDENYKFEVFHYTRLIPDLIDIIRSYHPNDYTSTGLFTTIPTGYFVPSECVNMLPPPHRHAGYAYIFMPSRGPSSVLDPLDADK